MIVFLALIDICMEHEIYDSSAKYLSVFFHVYHFDKIVAQIRAGEEFHNSSLNAHVNFDYINYKDIFSCYYFRISLIQ
jgi:hypothetical protein